MPPPTPATPVPPTGGEEPPAPPESQDLSLPWPALGLDRLGLTQAIGGLALGLIALFSSYDHISFAGRTLPLQQQWGIPFIAASVAVVVVDAQLATRSRLRAAHERLEERQRADQERDRADQERDRATEARERQAQNAEHQNAELALLRRSALLSARFQLDPTATNRGRLQTFLALINNPLPPG